MEATPVDLDTQWLFQAHVAKADSLPKMLEKSELTRLVWSFEHHDVKPEFPGESIRKGWIERSIVFKHSHSACALTGLDDKLLSSSIEPGLSSRHHLIK